MKNDETELLLNYKKLDTRGQYKLHTVIYEELDRMSNDAKKHPPQKEQVLDDSPVTLTVAARGSDIKNVALTKDSISKIKTTAVLSDEDDL